MLRVCLSLAAISASGCSPFRSVLKNAPVRLRQRSAAASVPMDAFITSTPRPPSNNTAPAEPRVQKQRVPVGWIDKEKGTVKLRGKFGDAALACVEQPDCDYFNRGKRKRPCRKLPAVFEYGLVGVLTPHVAWKEVGGPDDCVCLHCFQTFKSRLHGTEKLDNHVRACWAGDPKLEESGLLIEKDPIDRRTSLANPLDEDRKLELDVKAMRWVAGSGRPASVLNDTLLIDWVHDLSNGSYRPPERKFAGASGPLATIDVKLLKANIDRDLYKAWNFYSGQPFMWIYYDCWTNLSMVPFLGIETSFTRPDELPNTAKLFSKSERCGLTLGLLHAPGSHSGKALALKSADYLIENFPFFDDLVGEFEHAPDNFRGYNDLSSVVIGQGTDSGGGVPVIARLQGCHRHACYLHEGDLALSRALCLVGSDASRYAKLTADEQEVFKLIKRVRRLPAFFSNSSKRLEEYADVCEEIIEQCAGVSPNILKMVVAEDGTIDDSALEECPLDKNLLAGYLADLADDDQTDLAPAKWEGELRVRKLVNDCKTRMWAVSDMLLVIFKQRAANAAYAEEFDDFTDLHEADYKDIQLILGVTIVIAGVERFIEGERYNTLSVARWFFLGLLEYFERGKIRCPKMSDPGEDTVVKSVEVDFASGIAATVLKGACERLEQTVSADMHMGEACAVFTDARIKDKLFERLAERYKDTPRGAYWKEMTNKVTTHLTNRIAAAMAFEHRRRNEGTREAPAPSPATPEPQPTAERATKKVRLTFDEVVDPTPEPDDPATAGDAAAVPLDSTFFNDARQDVMAYAAAPCSAAEVKMKSDYDPIAEWGSGNLDPPCAKKKLFRDGGHIKVSYLAATALAFAGGQAAAGRPERLFRDAKLFNSALQQRQKPETMSQTAMLRRDTTHRASVKEVVKEYKAKRDNSAGS